MDPIQLTIIIVSFTLTLVIVVLSIQVWFILKEFRLMLAEMRQSIEKSNKILDDAAEVSGSVSGAVTGFAGMLSGLRTGLSVLSQFRKRGED